MLRLLLIFQIFLHCSRGSTGLNGNSNAGIEVLISEIGLNYAASISVNLLSDKLLQTQLADISDSKSGVEYSLSNIKITSFSKPTPNIATIEGTGVEISLSDASIDVSANWRYSYKKWFIRIRDSGSVTASATGLSIGISVRILNNNGRPTISAFDCTSKIGDLKIRVGGGGGWFYKILFQFFKDKLVSIFEREICKAATEVINTNGARELATLQLQARLNNYLTVDYSMVANPFFGPSFMESFHKAKFLNDAQQDQAPIMETPAGNMLGISISETVLNSACRVLYNANQIRYSFDFINSEGRPNILSDIIDLPYKDSSYVINLFAQSVPTIAISSSGITARLSVTAEIVAQPSGQPSATVFTLKFTVTSIVQATINGNILKGNASAINPFVTDMQPNLPSVSPALLTAALRDLVNLALPSINEYLNQGLPLPNLQGVSYIGTALELQNRYLTVSTNVRYSD